MSILDWTILIGFGAPILFFSGLFVSMACEMQRKEKSRG